MTASSIAVVVLAVAALLQHGGCHPTPQSPADRGARSLRILYRPWHFSAAPRRPIPLLSSWSPPPPPRAELPARRVTPFWELPPLVPHRGTSGSGFRDYSMAISVAVPPAGAAYQLPRLPIRYDVAPVTTLARPTRPPPMPAWVRLPPGMVAAPLFDLVESAQSNQQPIISINRPAVGPRTTSMTYLPTTPALVASPDRHSEEGATGATGAAAATQAATTTTTAATAEYSVLVVTRVGEETTATPWSPSGTATPPSTAWTSEATMETSTVPSHPDLPVWTAAAPTALPASETTTVGATDEPTTATAFTAQEDNVASVTSEAQPTPTPSTPTGTTLSMTEHGPYVTTSYVTEEPFVTTPYVTEEPFVTTPYVTTPYVTEEPFVTTPEVTSDAVVTTALPEKPTALTENPALTDSATEDGLDTIEIEINRLNKEEDAAAGTLDSVVVDAETTVSSTDTATTSHPFEATMASSELSEVFSTSAEISDTFSTGSTFSEAFSTTMDPSQTYPTTYEVFSVTPGPLGSTDSSEGDVAVSTALPPTTTATDYPTSVATEAPLTVPAAGPTDTAVPVTPTTPISVTTPIPATAAGTATTGVLYNRQTTGVPTPGPVRDFDYYDGVVFEDSIGSPADGYIPDYDDRSGEYDGDYFADSSSATRQRLPLQPPPWSDTKGLEIQSLVRETPPPPSDVHRRSDVLPEDEEDDDNEVGEGSDHEAASSAAPPVATAAKVYGDTFEGQMLRRMVPLVVRQLRLGHVSAEDVSRLQYIFGPIWPEVEQLAVGRRRRNAGRLRSGRYPHYTRWRGGDGLEAARRQPSASAPARRRRPQKSPRKKSRKKEHKRGHGHLTGPAAEGAASRKSKLHKDHARKGERLGVRKGSSPRPKRSSHHAVKDQDYDDEDCEKDCEGDDTEDYDSEDEGNEEYDEQEEQEEEEEEEADEDVVPSRVFDGDQDNPSVMELHYRARQSDSQAVPLHGPGRGPKPVRPSRPGADEAKAASAVEYEYY